MDLLLRRLPRLSRWVLLWFALYLGAASLAPWLRPPSLMWGSICTTSGMAMPWSAPTGSDDATSDASALQCPACLQLLAEVPVIPLAVVPAPSPLSYALTPLRAAHIAYLTAPPLPSRGPPPSAS